MKNSRNFGLMVVLLSLTLLSIVHCGCVSSTIVTDSRNPEVVIDSSGRVLFMDQEVELKKLARTMVKAGVSRSSEINILLPDQVEPGLMSKVTTALRGGGFTRIAFVTHKKTFSQVVK